MRLEEDLKKWVESKGDVSKFIRRCLLAAYKTIEGKEFVAPEEDINLKF